MAYSIRFSPPLTPTRSTHLRLLPLEALRPSEIPNRERDCDELRRQSTRASRTKTTVRENSESKWSTLCDVILTNTLVEDCACQYLSHSHISCCTLNVNSPCGPTHNAPSRRCDMGTCRQHLAWCAAGRGTTATCGPSRRRREVSSSRRPATL